MLTQNFITLELSPETGELVNQVAEQEDMTPHAFIEKIFVEAFYQRELNKLKGKHDGYYNKHFAIEGGRI